MYHRIGIKPYKEFSKGYKDLRKLIGLARYNPMDTYGVLFNWGNSKSSSRNYDSILNNPEAIRISRDKIKTIQRLEDANIRVPKMTTSIDEAQEYNFPVLCRLNYLRGGQGIHVAMTKEDLVEADFYTEYIPTKCEYRVHVFKDEILCWSKKLPKDEHSNQYIRNHEKGYKFSLLDNDRIFTKLKEFSINSIKVVGLDYGCVDVILGEDNKFYVLETNSAVGLEGTTLEKYAKAFRNYYVNTQGI